MNIAMCLAPCVSVFAGNRAVNVSQEGQTLASTSALRSLNIGDWVRKAASQMSFMAA